MTDLKPMTALAALLLVMPLAACGPAESAGNSSEPVFGATPVNGVQPVSPGAMQTLEIIDAQGFGQPMRAATIDVPAGWQGAGGINWDRSTPCVGNQMKLQWSATSPDRREAFELIPGLAWQVPEGAVQMNPCPSFPIRSAREFLGAAVQQLRPGARVLQYRDRPDLAGRPQGAQNGQRAEAGEIAIVYNGPNGEVQEILTSLVSFSTMDGNMMGSTGYIAAHRAPAGRLNPDLVHIIQRSIKAEPRYFAMVREAGTRAANDYGQRQSEQIDSWHQRRMADINARGAADRSRIIAETNREVADINRRTWENTDSTNDRIHERRIEGIREEGTWQNPETGGRVRGSIHGPERLIQMPDGTVIRTNDPYYNPPGGVELTPR